jgi:hypothetical protein
MQKTNRARASEIRALKRLKDKEIDTTDIRPVLDWTNAVVGKFYRPTKKPLKIRLDGAFSPESRGAAVIRWRPRSPSKDLLHHVFAVCYIGGD